MGLGDGPAELEDGEPGAFSRFLGCLSRAGDTDQHPPGMAHQDKAKRNSTTTAILVILAVVFVLVVRGIWIGVQSSPRTALRLPAPSAEQTSLPEAFASKKIPLERIYKQMKGQNLDKPRAYVAFYHAGRWGGEAWGEGSGLTSAIADAFQKAKAADKIPTPATDAMLVVPTDRTPLRLDNYKANFSNVHRGMRGAFVLPKEGKTGPEPYLLSPTKTIATNRSISDELEREARQRKLQVKEWLSQADIFSVKALQYYIPLSVDKPAEETARGNRIIPVEEVTQKSVEHFTELLSSWMFNNLHPNGRMTYMYYPSSGTEGRGNNMIRQWMGTVAMGRVAALHPERNLHPRVQQNIRYNLEQFYRSEGELGWIEYEGQAKLGAAALAMIGLIESPARAEFAEYEKGLLALTLHQWQESGEFHCFYKPVNRTQDNLHNFYPGETLLSWAFLYERSPDEALLEKTMKSFRYYKEWHLRNRNPAFIPWHTQAYYTIWKQTKSEELKDWIFEMNDWLVDMMQSNSRVAYDDTIGRFYAPSHNFGVPHASATGVYIEGLIDAFALAREIGDKKHEEKYRKSIILGLRSSMQLQFQDDQDMFYATNKQRLRGGMRTEVYDNEIRVDNVQHVLMGVQKVLERFKPEDYKL